MNIVFMSLDTLPSTLWARDLYDQMHIRSDFRKWFPRMCQYGFIEGRDYEYMPRVRLQDEGGRTVQRYVKDYRITQDMAKKLCKLHHTAVGAAYHPQPFDWDALLGLLHKKPPRRSSYEAQLSESNSLVTTTQMHRIKVRVLEHMSKFNLGFFQEHAPGQIKTTLFDDVDRIETFLAHSTLELAQAIVVPLMMFIFMLRLNWIMALIMLVPMILGIAIPMALMGRYPDLTDEFAGDTEKLNASANEFITAMPVIKMYHLTAEKFEQYRNSLKIYTDCWIKMCESSCNPLSIALVVLDSAILFTLPVGGWLYLRDSLSAASYLLFILLTMCFFTSFLNMVTIAMQSMELGSGLDNVKKIMDMETMKSGQQTLSKTGCYGIDFDNVTFNYTQGGKDALSDVDIHLEPGSLNAFVGPSGAGKTTAVQLLGRYWDVSSGTIKIGGVPVTELQTENLSDLTAFVFQDVFLLEDTLLENIRMGTDATEEQVRQAAKAAQIDDFIMSLPKGYATRIGDEGVKLSGGQQQRISIARAILKDAPIVVFDEATSYSDIENEHKIQLALQNLLRGKTTIMIAHRLHTIRNADKIFVFQDGKVVEQGTHDELIASGSTYSHMWDTYTRETIGEE